MSDLLEIIIPTGELSNFTMEKRHEIETALDAALSPDGIGEVTGGGTSAVTANIDVEVEAESDVENAVATIQAVLRAHALPAATVIHVRGANGRTLRLGTMAQQ